MNFPEIQALSTIRKSTEAEIQALSGNYLEGRFYEVIGTNVLRRALNATTLSEPVVFGTGNFDALAQRITTLENTTVTQTAFNTYQDSVTQSLAGKVDNSVFSNYQSTVQAALDNKLGKTEKAVDSTLFDGHTYAQVEAAWAASIAVREAAIMQAIGQKVTHIYTINFQNNDTIDAAALDVAANVSYASLADGKYMFMLNGAGSASANITNYAGSDALASHTGSNNDYYIVTVASGAVTSIARRNDTTNEALSAFQTVVNEQGNRITALEAMDAISGLHKDGSNYKLGGALVENTAITGNYDLYFGSRTVHKTFCVEDMDDSSKVYRIAIKNDEIVFGQVTFNPFL